MQLSWGMFGLVHADNYGMRTMSQTIVISLNVAKGLEFTHVLLMGVGKNILPQRFRIQGLSGDDRAAA